MSKLNPHRRFYPKEYRCAECKGTVQATREKYLTLRGGRFADAGLGDGFKAYCDSDCWHEDIDSPDQGSVIAVLVGRGLIEEGSPI